MTRYWQPSIYQLAAWAVMVAVLAFCLWAPTVLGSNRPYLWAINGTVLAGLAAFMLLAAPPTPHKPGSTRIAGLLFALLFLWISVSIVMAERVGQVYWGGGDFPLQLLSRGHVLTSYSQSDSALVLIALTSHALLWWVVVQLVRQGLVKPLMWGVLGVIVVHAAMGIFQVLGPVFLPKTLGPFDGSGASAGFVNHNHFATYLGLGGVIAVALALCNFRRMIHQGARKRLLLRVILSLSALGLIYAAIVLTQSRMGLAASATGVFVVIVLFGAVRHAWGTAVLFLAGFGLGLVSAIYLSVEILERYASAGLDLQTRFEIHRQSLELWHLRPWTGFGAGSFETVFATVRQRDLLPGLMITHAHSSYLTVLVEMGVIGGTLVAALFAWLVFEQVRALGRSRYLSGVVGLGCLSVIGIHATLDFSAEIYAVMSLLVLLLGMSTGVNQTPARMNADDPDGRYTGQQPVPLTVRTTQITLTPNLRQNGPLSQPVSREKPGT